MSNVIVDKQKIDILANAIADKSGVPVTMTLDEMKEAVDGIDVSGIVPTGTIDITHVGMTDVTDYATAHVYNADANAASWSTSYITENGQRKWYVAYSAYAESAGWVNEGPIGSALEYKMSAVPKNTSVTPTESAQTIGGANYMMEGAVTVSAIPSNYVGSGITRRSSVDMTTSSNIAYAPSGYYENNASIVIPNAVIGSGLYVGTGARLSTHNGQLIMVKDDNIDDDTFLVNIDNDGYIAQGQRQVLTGSVQLRANCDINDSSSMTVSGATVTAPAGYYEAASSKTVASGTEGTPTATKGSVSNHAVTVTPSVTNSAGYISGGTKNGTAVSVSASELVSGTYTVSASGTHDVTNYASASVASGTATASATKGTVSNHSVTVTPSVTRTAGYVTAGTATGTGVSVSASELVSGNLAITENGTNIDVTNYSTVSVAVEGGGGGGGTQIGTKTATPASASASISFTGLSGEPTSFAVISNGALATGASPYKTAAVVWDGSSLHGQTITNTTNAQVSYDGSGFSKSYSNGTLTITGTGSYFQNNQYTLVYSYGGTAASIDTADVQVGSGATSITFTGLSDEPTAWSCIFKSNFSTSSGYQRVIAVVYDGSDTYGMEMDSSAHYSDMHWSYTYNNGSLTISSQGTNAGGYFHQPGYYQLTAVYGEASPYQAKTVTPTTSTQVVEADSGYDALSRVTVNPIPSGYVIPTGNLAITQNGTGINVANYATVSVSVSGGSAPTVGTATVTNSSASNTSISFTDIASRPVAFFVRCTGSLTRSSNSSYYYVADMAMRKINNTETVVGNSYRMSNGNYAVVTSGYSFTYSGTTLTVSSSGSRSSAPGSFYNSGYELTYVY